MSKAQKITELEKRLTESTAMALKAQNADTQRIFLGEATSGNLVLIEAASYKLLSKYFILQNIRQYIKIH